MGEREKNRETERDRQTEDEKEHGEREGGISQDISAQIQTTLEIEIKAGSKFSVEDRDKDDLRFRKRTTRRIRRIEKDKKNEKREKEVTTGGRRRTTRNWKFQQLRIMI